MFFLRCCPSWFCFETVSLSGLGLAKKALRWAVSSRGPPVGHLPSSGIKSTECDWFYREIEIRPSSLNSQHLLY